MTYTHKADVTTVHPFPLDMLRYDSCWPESGEDALRIEKSVQEHPRERYTVTVCRHSTAKRDAGWTPGRWQSFGCAIDPRD